MKLILYSSPDNGVLEKLEIEIFPKNRKTVFGYMPADGKNPKPEYMPFWQDLAKKHDAEFVYIDNSKIPNANELEDIKRVNSLGIMGGNVFALLHNLRQSGLDKIIIRKTKEKDFIYSGFSAGAMIATPDIRLADKEYGWTFGYDENIVGVKDTRALDLVEFEILPHFVPAKDQKKLEKFIKKYNTKVKPLTDLDLLVLNK